MKFCTFAQISYSYLGENQTEGQFVFELLVHFVNPDKIDFIFGEISDSTYRSYFNGRRKMGGLARRILGSIDQAQFNSYLNLFSSDSIHALAYELAHSAQEKTPSPDVARKYIMSKLLKSIKFASRQRPGPKSRQHNLLCIKEELQSLLSVIGDAVKSNETSKLNYTAVKVKKKFSKYKLDEYDEILIEDIKHNIAAYYKYIENHLMIMDGTGTANSKLLLAAVKTQYLLLSKTNHDVSSIYYGVRNWIMKEANFKIELPAEILTAFFIQNCEVFDVPTK